jgi:hypothetical protein
METRRKKDKLKKQAEASSIRDKMDDMMKSREHFVNKTLEEKYDDAGEEKSREAS